MPYSTARNVNAGVDASMGVLGQDVDPYQKRWTQALGDQQNTALGMLREAQSGKSLGAQMVNQGVAQAQQKMAAQAVGSGANPAAERAAAYGAGNAASAGIGQGAQLGEQEKIAAMQGLLGAQQFTAQGMQGQANTAIQAQQAAWNRSLQMEALRQQRDVQLQQATSGAISGVASAAGGAAGLSDERRKVAIQHLESGRADDALAALRAPSSRVDQLERELGDAEATAPWRRRAGDVESDLGALGSKTDADLAAAVPRAPLGDTASREASLDASARSRASAIASGIAPSTAYSGHAGYSLRDRAATIANTLRALGSRTDEDLAASIPR